jgi:hypothetical protein
MSFLSKFSRKTRKRVNPPLKIEGDDEFKSSVKCMLKTLKEFSPDWYEKTLAACKVIKQSKRGPYSTPEGEINLPGNLAKGINCDNIQDILSAATVIPHEVQHIIDLNTLYKGRNFNEADVLESELRAGIAEKVYSLDVGLFKRLIEEGYKHPAWEKYLENLENKEEVDDEYIAYLFLRWFFNELKSTILLLVKEEEYREHLEEIEKKYFDLQSQILRREFLDESWKKFKEENCL